MGKLINYLSAESGNCPPQTSILSACCCERYVLRSHTWSSSEAQLLHYLKHWSLKLTCFACYNDLGNSLEAVNLPIVSLWTLHRSPVSFYFPHSTGVLRSRLQGSTIASPDSCGSHTSDTERCYQKFRRAAAARTLHCAALLGCSFSPEKQAVLWLLVCDHQSRAERGDIWKWKCKAVKNRDREATSFAVSTSWKSDWILVKSNLRPPALLDKIKGKKSSQVKLLEKRETIRVLKEIADKQLCCSWCSSPGKSAHNAIKR